MDRADRSYSPVIGYPASALQSRVASFEYSPGLRVDLYWPSGFAFDRNLPLVLFVVSLPDSFFKRDLGVSITEAAPYDSWCSMAAWMESRKSQLRMDTARIFLWAGSSNGDAAIALASSGGALEGNVRGMSLYYTHLGSMVSTPVPGFPVEVVIPEKDDPGKMRWLAAYSDSLGKNGNPVRVIRLPAGRHAFDLGQDTPEHRKVVEDTLQFMKDCLSPSP